MNIENKVVVVTGAASGIGRALAQAFKNARADKVYIADPVSYTHLTLPTT